MGHLLVLETLLVLEAAVVTGVVLVGGKVVRAMAVGVAADVEMWLLLAKA